MKATSAKRAAMVLFSTIIFYCAAWAEITSPFEAIRSHRQWITINTPDPSGLDDEELMLRAMDIIDIRLQEPETERILMAAARKVPEVKAYVNWTATLDCDTLFHRKREALFGMAKYLDSQKPGCYASRKIKSEWLNIESMFRNVLAEYDSLIHEQGKICGISTDSREKALHLSLKIARFDARNTLEQTDNPLYYPELWRLEDEVLAMYPANSTDSSAYRMQLYTQLAMLKNLPQDDLKVRLMLPDRKNPYDNGTLYEYTGAFKDYACNSGFYLDKAFEISKKIHGPYHPATAACAYFRADFNINNITIDSETVDNIRNLNDFMSMYYPRRSNEGKLCRLLKATADFQFSGNPGLGSDRDEILEISRLSYGESSAYYLNTLTRLTSLAVVSEPDYKPFVDFFESECRRIFPDALPQTLWQIYNCSVIGHRDPENCMTKMNRLKDTYLRHHDGSALSIKVGEELAGFFSNMAYNFEAAKEVHKTLADDTEKLFGKHSAMHFIALRNLFNVSTTGVEKLDTEHMSAIIRTAESKNFPAKEIVLNTLRNTLADYLWTAGNYEKAQTVYKKIHSGQPAADCLRERVRDAICRILSGKEKNSLEDLAAATRKEIDSATHTWLSPGILSELARYYDLTGEPETAVGFLEKAIEAHNYQTNYSLDDEYFDISGELAALYEATNNRTAAARLIASDRECIGNAHNLMPTYSLVNYLLGGYYRALSRLDHNAAFFYLGAAINAIQQIGVTSGGSDDMQFSLGISGFQAITTLFVTIDRQLKEAAEYLDSDDFKAYNVDIDLLLGQFTQWIPAIKENMTRLERDFPTYDPEYRKNPRYHTLLASFGAFYQACEHDYAKSEEYLLKCLDLAATPVDRKNILFNLAGLTELAKDSVKKDRYLALAYETIEKDPDRMSDTDRIGALAYRFNRSLKADDIKTATDYARRIYAENRRILDSNFQFMSSAEQERVFNTFGDPAWALTTLLDKDPQNLSAEAYDAVVYRTGMQLRSQQETRRIINESKNPDIRLVADSIATLRALHKQINITPDQWLTQEGSKGYNEASRLAFNIERLEMELLDLTSGERKALNRDITWQSVSAALKPSDAAVEFVISGSYIMALVVRNGSEKPVPVKLCPLKQFSAALESVNAKNSATMARRLYRKESAVDLYRLLWQPLETAIANAETIYFNAPGILHSIAFNAIETPDGGYLMDRYNLRQLTTTAQVTLLTGEETAPKSAALMGDVIFDPSQAASAGIMPEATGERAVEDDYSLNDFDSRGIARQYFRYLPFTATELKEISQTFGNSGVYSALRENASEKRLREMCAKSPDVLHLATHGFFISSETDAMRVPFMRRYSSQIGSPMQRSGVALANAEATWKGSATPPEDSDGILTAAEVATLDLRKTRLVTLSACETALGAYNFEGIHGLTRGFKQAGAKSLLVSLWSVNDKSTALFMSAFYRNWLRGGDRHAAYRQAVDEVREQYPSPFYWAPFIMLD